MKTKFLLHLAVAALAAGAATAASAACWHERTGEKTGINYADPECSGYVGATYGRAAYGMPARDEMSTTRTQRQSGARDCSDPAFRDDPQCMSQERQTTPSNQQQQQTPSDIDRATPQGGSGTGTGTDTGTGSGTYR